MDAVYLLFVCRHDVGTEPETGRTKAITTHHGGTVTTGRNTIFPQQNNWQDYHTYLVKAGHFLQAALFWTTTWIWKRIIGFP